MDALILPPRGAARGSVRPPGSKSIANRALPLAALAAGNTRLLNLPDGEDVRLMREALAQLGIPMKAGPEGLDISGRGGPFTAPKPLSLFLGNSGTCIRILAALAAAGEGDFFLDGVPRMRERPIADLVAALSPLAGSTQVTYAGRTGFPPLHILAKGLQGGATVIQGGISSQFLTGLLLALPLCREETRIEVEGRLVSAPYVELTLRVMEAFGVSVQNDAFRRFRLEKPSGYASPGEYRVEPDASSASYFLAAGAIAGEVEVRGIGRDSQQGEARFAEVLARMGARVEYGKDYIRIAKGELRGIDADMDKLSDTGMTLAVAALFATGPTVIRNIGNWRVKETDRIAAMAAELRKVGARAEEGGDWLAIHPPDALQSAEIDTYGDHRMAMCFSLACLGNIPVTIRDPGCVAKTYPGYFEDFCGILDPPAGSRARRDESRAGAAA